MTGQVRDEDEERVMEGSSNSINASIEAVPSTKVIKTDTQGKIPWNEGIV